MSSINQSPLGKKSQYIGHYQPDLLFPIARKLKRDEIKILGPLPFKGVDVWNAYEISWLNPKGKPIVALGEFIFPCESPNIIESKSFKLYLNSFNNTQFNSIEDVIATLRKDLSTAAGAAVEVKVFSIDSLSGQVLQTLTGICLDDLDIQCDVFVVDPTLLQTSSEVVNETVYSNLLKSNCLVTNQPDWGSVTIEYVGKKIKHENLLQYIVSFRDHNEFHEQCVERIFTDIMLRCQPQQLTVQAYYTRRGGLDINPFRTTEINKLPALLRLVRQ